jgi:hypothetical protein
MRNEEKILELRAMHKAMLAKIAELDPNKLPRGVDIDKLERAYDALKGYAWVLKKI